MQNDAAGPLDASVAFTEASPAPPEPAPYRAAEAPRERRPITHRPLAPRDFGLWLAIVAAVDVATWGGEAPVVGGFGLALAYALVGLLAVVGAGRIRRSGRLAWLGGALALLAVRMAVSPTDAANLAALAALFALPLVLRSRQISPLEVGSGFFAAFVSAPSRLLAVLDGARRLLRRTPLDRGRVLTIAIPAALTLVFVGVFALANPLVLSGVTWALEALGEIALPDFLRVLLWCVALGAGLMLLRPAPVLARGEEAAKAEGEPTAIELGVARNTLVALVLLFAGYLVLDAIHLATGRPPDGVTTQHYAHQGAFWLTVALALLTGTVGVMFRGPLAHAPEAAGVRRLATAWTALGLILALATYARLGVHVLRSGLSDLRIVGVLGITTVVVGMLLTLAKLRGRRSFLWLVRRQLDALAVVVVIYALLPTHLLGALVNVARVEAGSYGALLHVGPQARHAESVAVYLALLDHEDPRVREGVAAVLLRESATLDRRVAGHGSWREGDLVSPAVARALHDAEPELRAALGGAEPAQAIQVLAMLGEGAALDWSRAELAAVSSAPRVSPREDDR